MSILIDPEWVTVEPLDPSAPIDALDGHPYEVSKRLPSVRLRAQVDIDLASHGDAVEPGDETRAGTVVFDDRECARHSYSPRMGDRVVRVAPRQVRTDVTPYYVGELTPVGFTGGGSGQTAILSTRAPERRGSR
jgi:hypothetical protein